MGQINGSLLILPKSLETSNIPEQQRDKVIVDFFEMKTVAERNNDRFYTLVDLYSCKFSYGPFYPGFINMSWEQFSTIASLKGISQNTYQVMNTFWPQVDFKPLDSPCSFQKKEEPRAFSGFFNFAMLKDFVNNIPNWELWHRAWYLSHQQKIDWTCVQNDWFPRPDLVKIILRRELVNTVGLEAANKISESNLENSFHDLVMKKKGHEIAAYSGQIGEEICIRNYYKFEPELSSLEQQRANSLRKIFSIINRYGCMQFISIDFKHGMLEFHNDKGDHLGEFRFAGTQNSGPEVDHSLKCVDEWHRMNG